MEKEKNSAVKNIHTKYENLNNKAKTLLWVWVIIVLIIIILIIISGSNKAITSSHNKIEKAMVIAAEKYGEKKNLYGTKDQKVRIDLEELIDSKYLNKKDVTDNTCRGYVTYYSINDQDDEEEEIKIKSYINCKKYTTEGYKNQ